jgi:DNA uptake protein ComE-like DNA-binding protein
MKHNCSGMKSNRGAALLAALAALGVFLTLAMAFLSNMLVRAQGVAHSVAVEQAKQAASGGITSAIESIRLARAAGKEPAAEFAFELPLYMQSKQEEGTITGIGPSSLDVKIAVRISDECARLNINHASTRMLQALLGIDGGVARKLQSSLPRGGQPNSAWFTHIDELYTRGYVSAETLDAALRNELTVYTVADQSMPAGYLNVNTMSVKLLAALTGATEEEAKQLASKRPFNSIDDLVAAAGKPADTFALRRGPDIATPGAELVFRSNCYRVASTATLTKVSTGKALPAKVEAVVMFDAQNRPSILHWNLTTQKVAIQIAEDAAAPAASKEGEAAPSVPVPAAAEEAAPAPAA